MQNTLRFNLLALTIAGLVTIGAGCEQQATQQDLVASKPAAGPSLRFSSLNVDLGRVPVRPATKTMPVSIPVHNEGSRAVRLDRIVMSCKCVSATPKPQILQPGQSGTIELAVRTESAGSKSAALVVVSDDPVHPRSRIDVSWHAVAVLQAQPESIELGTIRPGETVERLVHLTKSEFADGNIGSLRLLPLATTAADAELTEDRSVRVRITGGEQTGEYQEFLCICDADDAQNKSIPLLRYPIRWNVRPRISCVNPSHFVGTVLPGAKLSADFVIQVEDEQPDSSAATSKDTPSGPASIRVVQTTEKILMARMEALAPTEPGAFEVRLPLQLSDSPGGELEFAVTGIVRDAETAVAANP